MDFGEIMKNFLPTDFAENLKNGVNKIAGKLEALDKDIQDIKKMLEEKEKNKIGKGK